MAQDEEQKAGAKARKPTKNELRRARKKAQKQEVSIPCMYKNSTDNTDIFYQSGAGSN